MRSIILIAYLGLMILGFAAYLAGANEWFGWHWAVSTLIYLLAAMFLRDLASIPVLVISIYGAWRGWDWPLVVAIFAMCPIPILTLVVLGSHSILSRLASRPRHGMG